MILYPFSLFIAFVAMAISIHHLGQEFKNYYDFVALMMVSGGTVAVAIATIPWEYRRQTMQGFLHLFKRERILYKKFLNNCLQLLSKRTGASPFAEQKGLGLHERIVNEGFELVALGLPSEKIETILKERIFQESRRARRVANSLRSLSKYPPAFGLVGTVLGLVNVMRGVSSGWDAQRTGLEMSVALVATLYGLIVSNLFVNPAGEMVLKKSHEEEELADIAVVAIVLYANNASLLEAQETLNSMVPEQDRLNILGQALSEGEQAA